MFSLKLKLCICRELVIWEACGDYWTLPRSQFEVMIVIMIVMLIIMIMRGRLCPTSPCSVMAGLQDTSCLR